MITFNILKRDTFLTIKDIEQTDSEHSVLICSISLDYGKLKKNRRYQTGD